MVTTVSYVRYVRIKSLYALYRPVICHKIPRYISRRDIIWIRSTLTARLVSCLHRDNSGMTFLARDTSWNYVLTTVVSFNSIRPAIIFTIRGDPPLAGDAFLSSTSI